MRYDPEYTAIAYPNGDVPVDRSVCTDVVVRALRAGLGYDLQKEVHEDMTAHFAAYPNLPQWNLSKPDAHIDHRRVPNLEAFFRRQGWLGRRRRRTEIGAAADSARERKSDHASAQG